MNCAASENKPKLDARMLGFLQEMGAFVFAIWSNFVRNLVTIFARKTQQRAIR